MAKRQKRAERLAATLRIVPKEPPKTTLNTDALTGERLAFGAPRVTVADDDRIAFPVHANPEDLHPHSIYAVGYRVSLPLRIHIRQTEGPLGGNAFAKPLLKYIQAGEPVKGQGYRKQHLSSADYAKRFWWTPVWAEAELRANFPADVVDVVLAVRRDQQDWDMAMVGCRRAEGDVKAFMRNMAAHCRGIIQSEVQAA